MTMQHKSDQNARTALRPFSAAAEPIALSTSVHTTGEGLLCGELFNWFEAKGVAPQGEIQKDLV